jgi:acyl-homoserine lactone acylase PvdQ
MNLRTLWGIFALILVTTCAEEEGPDLPGSGVDQGKTVVYRDTWGVPHIYAPTAEAGAYAMGWAQAEDRPEELLKNFLRGMGEIASVEGSSSVQSDLMAKLWDNYGTVEKYIGRLSPRSRAMGNAFVRGASDYYDTFPEDLPDWWGERILDEKMLHAFARFFLNSWSIGDGFDDLERGGIEANFAQTERASNQWAVSPGRSASGAAILLIDPHLSWFGTSRFWEFRIHAGELHGSGFTLPGFPVIGVGHNSNLAWAMTTGGPDTADIYELTLKEDDPSRYLYEDMWRQLSSREISIPVKDSGEQNLTAYYSHHGPIVARKGNRAYAMRTAYSNQVQQLDVWMELMFADDYSGVVKGLSELQLFPQNVMVADTSGNTFYQRTGLVGKRPEGFDWSRPVDGSTEETEWDSFHHASELVQLLNPPQGYMQNCNIPPDAMMVDSPLIPEKYPNYIFTNGPASRAGGWSNQRGARAVELLASDDSVTAEDAIAYAMDIHPFGVERWIEALKESHKRFGGEIEAANSHYREGITDLLSWDQQLAAESTAALKYYYWRAQVANASQGPLLNGISAKLDNMLASVAKGPEPGELNITELKALVQAFGDAMDLLVKETGKLSSQYGEIFRVGRGDQSWPIGGGGSEGTTTLRNIDFGSLRDDGTRWGHHGQSATQVVILTDPVRSWTITPIGQSDRPDSPHYADQARELFSKRKMKPSWWLPEDLKGNIKTRVVLQDAP